jgi:uncharacterized protein YraI
MHLGRLIFAGVAFAAAALMALPSQAAMANTNVNVREVPNGRILDVMRAGETADIIRQSGTWCLVDRVRRVNGWVACRYLDDTGRGGIVIGDRAPDVSFSFSIPGFSFFIGEPGFDRRPAFRPGLRDRVCFYEHVNYGGASFCARPGERISSLGSWNDRISSIRVLGNAEALVCEHNNFRGRCIVVDRSLRNLGVRGNDIISSIRVR